MRSFDTVEKLRVALLAYRETQNTTWLNERHALRPPAAIRNGHLQPAALAASASNRCLISRGQYGSVLLVGLTGPVRW